MSAPASITSGPWCVGRRADMGSGIARVDDRCGTPICYTEPMLTDEVANGNALLIAAAPDLLDLARRLLQEDADGDFTIGLIEDARAALAKAEGK